MDVRQSIHSAHAKTLDTQGLRNEFLVEKVFVADEYTMVYSHIDRIIVGGIMPVTKTVSVGGEVGKQLGVSYFLERRELSILAVPVRLPSMVNAMKSVTAKPCMLVKAQKKLSLPVLIPLLRRSFITIAHLRIRRIPPKKSHRTKYLQSR